MKKVYILIMVLITVLVTFISYHYNKNQPGEIYALSISSNAEYAISTDDKRQALLWNLKQHSYKLLDNKANIYSAYFIKHTKYFMWQNDITNEVFIKDLNGKLIKKFNPGFPTYGEVITTNLKNYFASDEDWSIFSIIDGHKYQIRQDDGGIVGGQKLLNLTLSPNNELLLYSEISGFPERFPKSLHDIASTNALSNEQTKTILSQGVVTWDILKHRPFNAYIKNLGKTVAIFDPQGKHIIAGDEDGLQYVWSIKKTEPIVKNYDLIFGKYIPAQKNKKIKSTFDASGLTAMPNEFKQDLGEHDIETVALKYIDSEHYVRFIRNIYNYVILYSTLNPNPIKYIKLNKTVHFPTFGYMKNMAIDSSYKQHILVTGKFVKPGIVVFKYDPKLKTIKQIWDSSD